MMKTRVFTKLIRSAMVACFAVASCMIVTTACSQSSESCPATCKAPCKTAAKEKKCSKPCKKPCGHKSKKAASTTEKS